MIEFRPPALAGRNISSTLFYVRAEREEEKELEVFFSFSLFPARSIAAPRSSHATRKREWDRGS